MYHPKRPTPTMYVLTTIICTIGVIAVAARVLHHNTRFTLVEPFDTITFVVGVTYAFIGPALGAWLAIAGTRRENTALRAEVRELRAERRTFDGLVEHIKKADSQGEVNTVLCRKILKELEVERSTADTQPIARLHSINGTGDA